MVHPGNGGGFAGAFQGRYNEHGRGFSDVQIGSVAFEASESYYTCCGADIRGGAEGRFPTLAMDLRGQGAPARSANAT